MLKIRKKLAEKKEASKGIAKAGFTLIELLVVLAILAILILLAAPRFLGYTKDAEVRAMQADAKVLANAALVYNMDNDEWPVTDDEKTQFNPEGFTDGEGNPGSIGVLTLNEELLSGNNSKYVQSLKNEFEDYALVAPGEYITVSRKEGDKTITETLQEGDIVFIGNGGKGVKDKDGNAYFAANIFVPGPTIVSGD